MSAAVTGRLVVWVDSYSGIGPEQLLNPPANLAQKVHLYREDWDMTDQGYAKIGTADVVLHIDDAQTVVKSQVEALRAKIDQERAESEAKVTDLRRRINDLLALPLDPGSAS